MPFASLQLHRLIRPLQYLAGLISLGVVLLVSSWAWLDSWQQPVNPVQSQCGSGVTPTVKSVAIWTPTLRRGQALFTKNCQLCHELTTAKLVGPGLLGVSGRVPDSAWLIRWIKSPAGMLQSGDVYAIQLVKAYTPVIMPSFPTLKEIELKAIIAYIDSYPVSEVDGME